VTLWRLVESGEIEAARIGRAVRISRASLELFMRSKVGA
jgi:excisionase family DNA binding protein